MSGNTIELKNIRSLSGMHFFIPDYQRGYRWSGAEAEQMLNDFKEFCRRKMEDGEFYCLQPIVVKKKQWQKEENGQTTTIDGYEVIDGQQRLTTLYILLKCLEDLRIVLYKKFAIYTIKYETRLEFDSQQFLENINNPSEDPNRFIDFYYMKSVYDSISKWLEDIGDDYTRKIIDALLGQDINEMTGMDNANNIRLIWYEVADEDKATSIDIFTRLNIGKIPLTNAELVKALFLRRGNFTESEASMKQLQISTEWNQIEQKLQDDSFWYFLCRTTWPFEYDNRIEFVFDLMKNRNPDCELYFTFNKFNEELSRTSECPTEQARVESVWQEIKGTFQTLEEWYEDRTLYHLIGFLIEYGENIKVLMENSRKRNKSNFLHFIKEKISKQFQDINLSDLNYGSDSSKIKKTLLLFNILTVLQSCKSDMRFPFSKYKKEKWDIEHICSQTDRLIYDDRQRKEWISDMLEFYVGSTDKETVTEYIANLEKEIETTQDDRGKKTELELISKIFSFYNSEGKINGEFNTTFDDVQKYFEEDILQDKDYIGNLTLLDAQTNRGYGNAFFPIKRKWIISNDSQGIFVPIATKNVFLKYYSQKGNNLMRWSQSDAEDYFNAIEQTLNPYLKRE